MLPMQRTQDMANIGPLLPDTITVSGHVYDVTTGLVTTIVPAAQMHHRMSGPRTALAR